MIRRSFLASILSLPFLRWFRPVEALAPVTDEICTCCDPTITGGTWEISDGMGRVVASGVLNAQPGDLIQINCTMPPPTIGECWILTDDSLASPVDVDADPPVDLPGPEGGV